MIAESRVRFEGPGPFSLPVAQRATATGHPNNGVTMTVYSLVQVEPRQVAGHDTEVVPISIQMTSDVARELAMKLLAEAEKGDRKRK
jgi:hypothetical protein